MNNPPPLILPFNLWCCWFPCGLIKYCDDDDDDNTDCDSSICTHYSQTNLMNKAWLVHLLACKWASPFLTSQVLLYLYLLSVVKVKVEKLSNICHLTVACLTVVWGWFMQISWFCHMFHDRILTNDVSSLWNMKYILSNVICVDCSGISRLLINSSLAIWTVVSG